MIWMKFKATVTDCDGDRDDRNCPAFGKYQGREERRDTLVVTIKAKNGNVGPAYNVLLQGFSLTQIPDREDRKEGKPEERPCMPQVTPPTAFPVALGDIPCAMPPFGPSLLRRVWRRETPRPSAGSLR